MCPLVATIGHALDFPLETPRIAVNLGDPDDDCVNGNGRAARSPILCKHAISSTM